MKSKSWIYTIITIFICTTNVVCVDAKQVENPTATARSVISKYQSFFFCTTREEEESTKSLIQLYKRAISLDPSTLNEWDWEGIVEYSFDYSAFGYFGKTNNKRRGVLQDDQVLELFLALIKDDYKPLGHLRNLVYSCLVWQTSHRLLKKHTKEILSVLGDDFSTYDKMRLYALCELTPKQKEKILNLEKVPLEALARCGDKKAEQLLIKQFEKAKKFSTISSLGKKLAYIGSLSCAEALVKKLRSPICKEDYDLRFSVSVPILKYLGMIYEDEPLFMIYEYPFLSRSFRKGEMETEIKTYVQQVDKWVQQHFHHSAWGPKPRTWFWLSVPLRMIPGRPPPIFPPLKKNHLSKSKTYSAP